MVIPCPVCQKPMGERHGNTMWILRPSKGDKVKIEINVTHYGNGDFKMTCPCGGASIFSALQEKIDTNN